jgi:hypothetical protein
MAVPLKAACPASDLREHSLLRVSDSRREELASFAGRSDALLPLLPLFAKGGERECLLSFLVTVIPKNDSPLVYLD